MCTAPPFHLLVQVLGQHVDLLLVAAGAALVPELKLGNHLQETWRGGGKGDGSRVLGSLPEALFIGGQLPIW